MVTPSSGYARLNAVFRVQSFMCKIVAKDLPQLYKSILQGKRKLVVWGMGPKRDLTIFEWQRQVPAEFIIDPGWEQRNGECFQGLSLRAPEALQELDPNKTIVLNNNYYIPSARNIEACLAQLGDYPVIEPAPLHLMARCVARHEDVRTPSLVHKKNFVEFVNQNLGAMLVAPAELGKKHSLPNLRELMRFFGTYDANDYLARALPKLREKYAPTYSTKPGHVCLLAGVLDANGAVQQLCNLAVGLKHAGWTPRVLVYQTTHAEALHFQRILTDAGVDIINIAPSASLDPAQDALAALQDMPSDILMTLWHLRAEFVVRAIHTFRALRRLRPELLISYLEWPNVFNILGGLMAGTPHMIVSTRSLAPTHSLHFFDKFVNSFRDIYRIGLFQNGVTFNSNSLVGARSHAAWLRVPVKKLPVVRNCISQEFIRALNPSALKAKRKRLRLTKNQPLILGAFRLSVEKRPFDFVKIIAALRRRHPGLRAIICGHGILEKDVRHLIRRFRLHSVLTLAGAVDDMPVLMRVATFLLHVSEIESSPNVILEAQAVGLPVVSTNVAGALEILAPPWRAYAQKPGDIKGFTAACDRLLNRSALCSKFAETIRTDTQRRFSLTQLARETLKQAGLTLESASSEAYNRLSKKRPN